MVDLSGFDASQVPEQQDFSPLPEGRYLAIITASEEKATKRGDAKYLQFTLEVIDGPQKNRKVWARLNLWHPNKTTVDIAQRELGAMCRAIGMNKPGNSLAMHNKPMFITVGVEIDDRNRESNVIKKYEEASVGTQNGGGAPAFAQPAPAAAAAAVAPPWTPPWR